MKKLPDDLERLDREIASLKQKEMPVYRKGKAFGHASNLGLRIGAELLSAVIVGSAIGYVIDEVFATKPWFLVVFLFFGGAAGFVNVYRLSKKEDLNE